MKQNEIDEAIEFLRQNKGVTRDLETTQMNRHLDVAIRALTFFQKAEQSQGQEVQ